MAKSLYQRVKQFLKPAKPKRRAKVPQTSVLNVNLNTDKRLTKKQPDVYVEVARDVAADIQAHPEKYLTTVLGTQTMVVDDATYEALFYLFAGKTRQQMWDDEKRVCALFVNQFTIVSESQLAEARRSEQGWK